MNIKSKKIIPYTFMMLVLIVAGLFGPAAEVRGQTNTTESRFTTYPQNQTGACNIKTPGRGLQTLQRTYEECLQITKSEATTFWWVPSATSGTKELTDEEKKAEEARKKRETGSFESNELAAQAEQEAKKSTALEKAIGECGILGNSSLASCLLQVFHFFVYGVGSTYLVLAARFLNLMLTTALSSALFGDTSFLPDAWRVVRDLSNIFFILILLYAAIRLILGLGGAEVKKTVTEVVIMALLINFSMFASKVVIDASNILALVFYNKISVESVIIKDGKAVPGNYVPLSDQKKTGVNEKDIAGGLAAGFNPNYFLTEEFFKVVRTKTQAISGAAAYNYRPTVTATAVALAPVTLGGSLAVGAAINKVFFKPADGGVPPIQIFWIILASGIVMYVTMWCFFVAGLAFLMRLIELWILIIFSPFAFMSLALPQLRKVEYIGWDNWLARLLKTSFMAPIFMFFLYFIFKIVQSNIFQSLSKSKEDQGTFEIMLLVFLPLILVVALLLRAIKFAKEGSGVIGEKVTQAAKVLGGLTAGLTLAAVTGGTSTVLQASAGRLGAKIQDSTKLKDAESRGVFGAKFLRNLGGRASNSSFDARKIAGGAIISGIGNITGLKLKGSDFFKKDSYREDFRKKAEAHRKRAEGLKPDENEASVQTLHHDEETLQKLLEKDSHEIEQLKGFIVAATEAANAAKLAMESDPDNLAKREAYRQAAEKLKEQRDKRGGIKNGEKVVDTDAQGNNIYNTDNGKIGEAAVRNARKAEEKAEAGFSNARAKLTNAQQEKHAAELSYRANPNDRTGYVLDRAKEAEKNAQREAQEAQAILTEKENKVKEVMKEVLRTAEQAFVQSLNQAESQAIQTQLALYANPNDPNLIQAMKQAKENIEKAMEAVIKDGSGSSINDFEDEIIPRDKKAIQDIERKRLGNFARLISDRSRIRNWSPFVAFEANDRAAYQIIKENKLDSGGKR